jgi:transglutaminase-like putative cysteine protease
MTTCETKRSMRVLYSAPVTRCVRRICTIPPANRGAQEILDLSWKCKPDPDNAREIFDDFGNRILELTHHRILHEFHFEMSLRTRREHCNAARDENLSPPGIGAFLLPSARCDYTAEIARIAEELKSGFKPTAPTNQYPIFDFAKHLCAWTHGALRYDESVTQIETTASQALARGAGVCQDYAHLMIALCRAAHIPARYISGFNPAEGAMHAWVEVLCEGRWHAFDPTHNRETRPDCVYVACGRDFRDVVPHAGTFRGKARAELKTSSNTRVVASN